MYKMVVNFILHGKIAIMAYVRSINISSGAKEKPFDNTKCCWGLGGKENFYSVDSGKSTGTQLLKKNLALPHRTDEPGFPCLRYITNGNEPTIYIPRTVYNISSCRCIFQSSIWMRPKGPPQWEVRAITLRIVLFLQGSTTSMDV